MTVNTVIKNCFIVSSEGIVQAGLAIEGGKIVAIARDQDLPLSERTIDVQGRFVIPGLVDAHMHLEWPPGVDPVRNIRVETQACASAGVTTVIHLLAPADRPLEKAEECTHRLVDSFHHCLFVLQLAGLEKSPHFFSELSLTVQPIKNHQTFHRQPFGYHVKEVRRTWKRAIRVIAGDAATGDDPAVQS